MVQALCVLLLGFGFAAQLVPPTVHALGWENQLVHLTGDTTGDEATQLFTLLVPDETTQLSQLEFLAESPSDAGVQLFQAQAVGCEAGLVQLLIPPVSVQTLGWAVQAVKTLGWAVQAHQILGWKVQAVKAVQTLGWAVQVFQVCQLLVPTTDGCQTVVPTADGAQGFHPTDPAAAGAGMVWTEPAMNSESSLIVIFLI